MESCRSVKFSIITPTYNRASLIERTIKSVLNQTYQEFEMIIIDDGSTDDTDKIVSKYLDDKRVRYFKIVENRGVNEARNCGILNISQDSQWVTFLDSDDEFYHNALEHIFNSVRKIPNVNSFRFPIQYIDNSTRCNLSLINVIGDYSSYLKSYLEYGDWVSVINRKVIDQGFLFDTRVKAFESLTWLKFHKKEKTYYDSNFILLCHVDNTSLSRPANRNIQNYENEKMSTDIILNEYGLDFQQNNKKAYLRFLYEQSRLNVLLGNKKIGIEQLIFAMRLDTFNIGVLRVLKNLAIRKKV